MTPCPVGLFPYTIRSGDTLWLLSQRYYTTVNAITAANPGLNPNNLPVGQTICIPAGRGSRPPVSAPPVPAPPSGGTPGGGTNRCPVGLRTYTIQRNDTLGILAQRYCTTVNTIMAVNPSIDPNNLTVGQTIWIPAGYRLPNMPPWFRSQTVTPEEIADSNDMTYCPENTYSYTIESGDTIWLLSQRFQTTTEEIMAVNPGINPANLFVGQVICIPRSRNNESQPLPLPQPIPQPTPQPIPLPTPQPIPQPTPQPIPQPTPQPIPQPLPEPLPEPPLIPWISIEEQNLNNYLRLLWAQHAYWTRMAMQSLILDLPDAQSAADRLMQNPIDFEMALQTFYGNDAAADFAELLNEHLTLTSEFIIATREGNTDAAADAERRWYENADQIASFLGSINPNWSTEEWRNILDDYLALLLEDIGNMLSGNFEDSIDTFTDIEREALEMADIMTQGIVTQFPQYFR